MNDLRKNPGFTVVEMLIALAITALLLASVAIAVHGGLLSYTENTRISDLIHNARVVLDRMTSEIRTAQAVNSGEQRLTVEPPANPGGVTEIEYELDDGVLYYRRTVGGVATSYPLVGDDSVRVEAFTVDRQTAVDDEGMPYTVSVKIQLTLAAGENRFTGTASACPRRNQAY